MVDYTHLLEQKKKEKTDSLGKKVTMSMHDQIVSNNNRFITTQKVILRKIAVHNSLKDE